MPKRPEINASDFAKALDSDPIAAIPFDPQTFGTAANNGQMIAEIVQQSPLSRDVPADGAAMTGRGETQEAEGVVPVPLIEKLRRAKEPAPAGDRHVWQA